MSKGWTVDISCDVCCDLIPLVRDGVASADSEALVRGHTAHCEACRALLEQEQEGMEAPGPGARTLRRLRRGLALRALAFVLMGVCGCWAAFTFGFSNSYPMMWALLALGVLARVVMGRWAWPLSAGVGLAIGVCFLCATAFDFGWGLLITLYCTVIIALGAALAALLQFAFGGLFSRGPAREREQAKEEKTDGSGE